MKRALYFLAISIVSLLLVLSCGNSKLAELKTTVKDVAMKLNDELVKIRNVSQQLDKEVEDLYANTDMSTVDIKGMDESEGGRFYLFQNAMYVRRYDSNADETAIWATGAKPVDDDVKKVLKMLSTLNDSFVKIGKENPNIARITYGSVDSEVITHPNGDVVSMVPVKLNYNIIPYFKEAIEGNKGDSYWRPPAISNGAVGVIMSRVDVVTVNNQRTGVCFTELKLLNMLADLISDIKSMVFIAFKDTSVYGATDALKKNIGLKVTEQVDYTEQLKANKTLSDEFKLTNEKNSDEIKTIGALISQNNVGKDDLSVTINKKKYNVVIESVSEQAFFVVGLL